MISFSRCDAASGWSEGIPARITHVRDMKTYRFEKSVGAKFYFVERGVDRAWRKPHVIAEPNIDAAQ